MLASRDDNRQTKANKQAASKAYDACCRQRCINLAKNPSADLGFVFSCLIGIANDNKCSQANRNLAKCVYDVNVLHSLRRVNYLLQKCSSPSFVEEWHTRAMTEPKSVIEKIAHAEMMFHGVLDHPDQPAQKGFVRLFRGKAQAAQSTEQAALEYLKTLVLENPDNLHAQSALFKMAHDILKTDNDNDGLKLTAVSAACGLVYLYEHANQKTIFWNEHPFIEEQTFKASQFLQSFSMYVARSAVSTPVTSGAAS